MAIPVTRLLWCELTDEGRDRTDERLAGGERIAIVQGPVTQDPIFALVSISDLKALSAISDLRVSQLAALLDSARNQAERKAIVRLIDWLEKYSQDLD